MLVFLFSYTPALGAVIRDPSGDEVIDGVATVRYLEAIFSNVINVALYFAAIVLLIIFFIGGFRYMTAGGDSKATEAAKATLTHAIAGLLVLVFGFIILQLIKKITGVDVTIFRITR